MIGGVRDIQGLAPKAGKFNRLSQNMEEMYLDVESFEGALLRKSGSQVVNPGNFNTEVSFDTTVYDTNGFAIGASKLAAPIDGVARISANLALSAGYAGNLSVEIYKNGTFLGSSQPEFFGLMGGTVANNSRMVNFVSPMIIVEAGDEFTLRVTGSNGLGTPFTINSATGTWFAIEMLT